MSAPCFFDIQLNDQIDAKGSFPGLCGSLHDRLHLDDISRLFEILRPHPSPFPLVRIGGSGDGAYLIPSDLDGIEACFSPGVDNFKNFEDELSLNYGIDCHMCDFSSDVDCLATPLHPNRQTFEKRWLASEPAADSITLAEWVERRCESSTSDLILQMDIEGAEYKILLSLAREVLARFRIIVIEFHSLHRALVDSLVLRQVCLPLLNKLAQDFVCVHAHPNNYQPFGHVIPGFQACLPEYLELSFLRRDRFSLTPLSSHRRVLIPHPLDVENVPEKPPFFLEAAWCSGKRPWRSQLKIQRERLLYLLRSR